MVEKTSSIATTNELVVDRGVFNSLYLHEKLFHATKRTFDMFVAVIGLILTSPILLLTALAIKLEDGGPVFFKQVRTGKDEKNFNIIKFRSCVVKNGEKNFKTKDQYTKVGKIIRKLSVDELPQLFNIIKGEMSLIGPRPWIVEYHDNMNENQRRRYNVLPGITGLAQAKGRNDLSIFEKINYDIEYVENQSIKEDLKVIYYSINTVLSRKGVEGDKTTIGDEISQLKHQKGIR